MDHARRIALALALALVLAAGAGLAKDSDLPEGLVGFSGQVRGVVVAKEKGFFTFRVAKLLRTWKDSEAAEPESISGRTIRVGPRWEKVEGRWRAVPRHVSFIRSLAPKQEITLEVRYSEAGRFAILELSEEQRKAADRAGREAAKEKGDRPRREGDRERALPEGVAGFVGRVRGKVVEKLDGGVVRFEIEKATRVWKGNRATNLEAMEGLRIRVGPRFEKKAGGKAVRNELHVRFLRTLEAGEKLDLEIRHGERDYFPILELTRAQRARAERGRREE